MYQLLMSGSLAGLFFQVLPASILASVLYAFCRYTSLKGRRLSPVWEAEIMRGLFVCYLTGLFCLLLAPNNLWTFVWAKLLTGSSQTAIGPLFTPQWNLIPSLIPWAAGELTLGSWVLTMLAANFFMFIPMGFFLPLISQRAGGRGIWKAAVGIPVAVELLQPIVGRSFDADDILCNLLGILAGFAAFRILKALFPRFAARCQGH